MARFRTGAVRVRVPATSANLGPGFDCLGLALALYDEVTAQVSGQDVRVELTGEGAGEVPVGERHLVVASMLTTFDRMSLARPPGLRLTCRNRIPHARGLGSSSAAIMTGILLARSLVDERVAGLDDPAVLRLAAEIEGHPDNVAACLLGGLTIAWTGPDGGQAVRLRPSPGIHPVVFIPAHHGLTGPARAILPESVPLRDAAFNAGRAALLVHALTVDPSVLLAATEDRLHQDYRAPAMPQTVALVRKLRAEGVPAVVSGAGPSVLALPAAGVDPRSAAPDGWRARSLSVARAGARILVVRHADPDPVAAGPPS